MARDGPSGYQPRPMTTPAVLQRIQPSLRHERMGWRVQCRDGSDGLI
jgi:hypothetical protein